MARMCRIRAINEESDSEEEDDTGVTREIEEQLIYDEYLRALRLKSRPDTVDNALSLFNELLEAEIIFEVKKTQKKMMAVKYNCYKNIGLIHEQRRNYQLALAYLSKAIELDDNDAYICHKLGRIALHLKKLGVAQSAFQKCLNKNPTHRGASDGILQILCERESYNEAYGWALVCYDRDRKNTRALDVILEIRELFSGALTYIENSWSIKFKDKHLKRTNTKSAFPTETSQLEIDETKPNVEQFKIESFEKLNWFTFGSMISQLYDYLLVAEDGTKLICMYEYTDFLLEAVQIEPPAEEVKEEIKPEIETEADPMEQNEVENEMQMEDKQENSNSESIKGAAMNPDGTNSADGSTEDSDAPIAGDEGPKLPTRSKSRRRGSDLTSLDRWYFWKTSNRKCSQRQKNKQIERMESDTTIKGFLENIMEKFDIKECEEQHPFNSDLSISSISERLTEDSAENEEITCEKFQESTKDTFAQLIEEIKQTSFDVITLITKWTDCISTFWEKKIPNEILDLYIKLFPYYIKHQTLSTWMMLDEKEFRTTFRMTLFYLELCHERAWETADPNKKNDVDLDWFKLYNHLIFHSGLFKYDADDKIALKYEKRFQWMLYCVSRYEHDLRASVNYLEKIFHLIPDKDTTKLILPNLAHNKKIDKKTVIELIDLLNHRININYVPQWYKEGKFEDLIQILEISIRNTTKVKNIENSPMKLNEQFEVILESFWNLNNYDDCLIWCEKCLKYSIDKFEKLTTQMPLYLEWARTINFILTYVETLIRDIFIDNKIENNSSSNEGQSSYSNDSVDSISLIKSPFIRIVNCLGKYYKRLVASIVRIISNQLDTDERNTSQLHPVNLKTPWVILHQILQREENTEKIRLKLKMSEEKEEKEEDIEDDLIPKSISIFFTAHEYLGNRTWCTKNNGEFLLYVMDTVTQKLGLPMLDQCQNEIVEYLEQVTYCLYRYPAKRARLKHIENHESQVIELDWSHAMQLYFIYEPKKMPEFDDFKRNSITSDMEQLLQRIIAIMPPEIDPSTSINRVKMEKFIRGELNELPNELNILPFKVRSIFYLLADFYFKNKEISKALKYYIADLSNRPTRFHAWAGLALSKADLMGTKLSSCTSTTPTEMIQESDEVLRCFEQCLKIDEKQQKLWIEYGSYAYTLHSYCSRCLKQNTESTEISGFLAEKKEKCLEITHNCFTEMVNMKLKKPTDEKFDAKQDVNPDVNVEDEKWLYHYMLGKVAEKRKKPPNIVIDQYLKSAEYLHESGVIYPLRISSANTSSLVLEALEIFYRITATIIKYMERHSVVEYSLGKYFINILKQQAVSPFALNQAKVTESTLNAVAEQQQRKRKINVTNEETSKSKLAKVEVARKSSSETKESDKPSEADVLEKTEETKTEADVDINEPTCSAYLKPQNEDVKNIAEKNADSSLRRGSQESSTTTTTQSTATASTSSSGSTSSSSDSDSSSDSSSDGDDNPNSSNPNSSSEEDSSKDENAPLDERNINLIYKMCIKNFEECITRYAEHHKSFYRLVLIYMNGPERIRDIEKCNQLLLGSYTTNLGNSIAGLFAERKNNNIFHKFWRNYSPEIERAGSFSAHLSKCTNILMQILRINHNYKLFLEIIFYMQRVPDADKRYITENERKDLLERAMSSCIDVVKELLKKHSGDQRNDNEILTLLIEIYRAHKKMKNASPFSGVIVDAYKSYAENKTWLQEDANYFDCANKFCGTLTNALKNLEKEQQLTGVRLTLEEIGLKHLGASLTKVSVAHPNTQASTENQTAAAATSSSTATASSSTAAAAAATPSSSTAAAAIASTSTAPTGRRSPNVARPPASVSVNTPPTTTTTTTTRTSTVPSVTTPSVTSTVTSVIQSRPRGRPPGSKNTVKQTDTSKKVTMQQLQQSLSSLTPLLQPYVLSNMQEVVLKKLDPHVVKVVLQLIAEPKFMETLSRFPDSTSRSTLLTEYFKILQFDIKIIQKYVDGFNTIFNYLSNALQTQASMANLQSFMMPQTSAPKTDKNVQKPTSAAMSVFPTANIAHSSMTTSPSKLAMNPSISATITPVSSSPNLLKSGASTVISVGSGQLTITPSISITPNPTKSTSGLPEMPAPNFISEKPKVRRSTGNKPPKVTPKTTQKAQRSSLGANYPVTQKPSISMDINLPESLSITRTPFVPPQLSAKSPMTVDLLSSPVKEPKPKKKSIDGSRNIVPQPKKATTSKLSGMDLLQKSLANPQHQSPMNPMQLSKQLLSQQFSQQYNYLSHYQQFLSGVPQTPLTVPKPGKSSTVTTVTSQQPKSTIKVKQLDQLQGHTSPKMSEKPKQKSKQPAFQPPNISNPPMSRNPTVLNSYGTTISSVSQTMQSNFSPSTSNQLPPASSQLPANLQISPTKSLQQRLAERQRQFHDANSQSRPSSTSSAGSSKTPKSDTDVIILD